MDYARKIGKSDEDLRKWVKQRTPFVSTHDLLLSQEQSVVEDKRLVNWKRWLATRRKQYRHIQSETGRHQTDQLLNSCEKVRPLIEMRNLVEYATIPVPIIPDKYRGGPEFWHTPHVLPNRKDPCLPGLRMTPTKAELNIPPDVTYVGLPELIEKEKNLVGLRSKEPLWKRSQYLTSRKNQLRREINLLVPKEPEIKRLVIEGHAPKARQKEPRIPPISISAPEDDDVCPEDPCQMIVLKIQDREITWEKSAFIDAPPNPEPMTWNLTFSSKVNKRAEERIIFENKGNRVIDYRWREAPVCFTSMKFERQMSPFFFNKTKGLVLPGQFVALKIWYLPRTGGVSKEHWRLVTEPELCPSPLIFRFWGCAEKVDYKNARQLDPESIDRYLDRCARDSIIKQIIRDIMEDIDHTQPPEPAYGSLFLESEIFTSKNPFCFYYPNLVIEFRQIYRSATNRNSAPWNLSLNDLREVLLQINEPTRRHETLVQFSELYKKCLKPTLGSSWRPDKHRMAYNLLSSFANQFEIESEHTRNTCLINECNDENTGKTPRFSQGSIKSTNASTSVLGRNGRKSTTRVVNNKTEGTLRSFMLREDYQLYRQIFFIRIHELLGETVEQISATIDSFNRLNRDGDK